MAIVRGIPGRERDPVRVAALRGKSCRESEAEFAACLTGTWREEHLFNLESALRLYNAVRERVTAYKARLLEEIRALETEERHKRPPPHGGGVAAALPHRLGGRIPPHDPPQGPLDGNVRHRTHARDLVYHMLRYGQSYVDIGESTY